MLWRQSVQSEIDAGNLREIVIDSPPLRDKLFIVRRTGNRLTPLQRRMLTRLRAAIDEQLGEQHPAIG
jgi:DNA-binding transcriptional LysR family regulator